MPLPTPSSTACSTRPRQAAEGTVPGRARQSRPALGLSGRFARRHPGAWFLITQEGGRYAATRRVAASPSEIRMSLTIHRQNGPIALEEYRIDDMSGLSTSEYRAVNRKGLSIRVEALPRETTDVPFLFDQLVQDGVWEFPRSRGEATRRRAMPSTSIS